MGDYRGIGEVIMPNRATPEPIGLPGDQARGHDVMMRRPRVKPEHAAYRISGGRIRIGGVSYGIAAEIEDPTGSVWTLLESMDGTRSVTQIIDRAARAHPDEPEASVRAAVRQLMGSGYVEDAGAPDPAELSERDKQRYDRARRYYRWLDLTARASTWEPQARLRAARVTVIGIGGTGGVASLALAAAGVGRLHCVDPDVVELSNLSRQVIYTEDDIGAPKADAAVARLRRLNTDIAVSGERRLIGSVDDVLPLVGDCDVLVLTADQPPDVRVWTNRACIATGRPWVDAGYHGPLVQVGVYRPGAGSCWECLHDASREQQLSLGANPCDAPDRPAAAGRAVGAVSAGISGYLAAHEVIALLTGVPPAEPGRIQAINLAAFDAPYAFAEPPRPSCPACAADS
jgi:molybdopterin-synthase adenylyltransferase